MHDVIVIGAGVEGSGTAYQLCRRGYRVLLLEQFSLPTTRGSSHGANRVTRRLYSHPVYYQMTDDSHKEWAELERKTNQQLRIHGETAVFGNPKLGSMQALLDYTKVTGMKHNILRNEDIQEKYENLINLPNNWIGISDPDGGILKADKCLIAFWQEIKKMGGDIKDAEKVTKIFPGHQQVTVETSNGHKFAAKSIVLCLGSWAGKFLNEHLGLKLPLKAEMLKIFYCEQKVPNSMDPGKFPCTMYRMDNGRDFYGLPAAETGGLFKCGLDFGLECDPDYRDNLDTRAYLNEALQTIRQHFPGVKEDPSIIDTCIYTLTPDSHPILDRHPNYPNIIIGAGFSGHGFKLGPVIGNILADLVGGLQSKYDMRWFSLDRFGNQKKAML